MAFYPPYDDDDLRKRAIDHFISELEKGVQSANCIMADMPKFGFKRFTKQTLHVWRANDPELAERIDEAFEVGCDRKAENAARIAAGEKGFSSGNVKRDRLMLSWEGKQLSVWNHRYRNRQVHSNDPENPMPSTAPQFIVQPVMAQPAIGDDPLPQETEEDQDDL